MAGTLTDAPSWYRLSVTFAPPDANTAWANADLWDYEYEVACAIPSSHRLSPSHAFSSLESELALNTDARVLDAGAGTGRHTIYLALKGCRVESVDVSYAACEMLKERLRSMELQSSVVVVEGALQPWDLPSGRYDLIIDSYVSCHLLSEEERLAYIDALMCNLAPGGRLYTSCMGGLDGYYKANANPGEDVVTDPLNGIRKLLQDREEFFASNARLAPIRAKAIEHFQDPVGGLRYTRQVLAAVLERPA